MTKNEIRIIGNQIIFGKDAIVVGKIFKETSKKVVDEFLAALGDNYTQKYGIKDDE